MSTKRKCFSNGVNLVDVAEKMAELRYGYYDARIYQELKLSDLTKSGEFFLTDYNPYTGHPEDMLHRATLNEQILLVLFVATIIGHNT
jgi:hypothetical protein